MAEITITGALVYKGVAEEIISNKNGKKYTNLFLNVKKNIQAGFRLMRSIVCTHRCNQSNQIRISLSLETSIPENITANGIYRL